MSKRVLAICILLTTSFLAHSQTQPASNVESQGFPAFIRFGGQAANEGGAALAPGNYDFRFSIYESKVGEDPIWVEQQVVAVGENSRFSVLLGATDGKGVPPEIFSSTSARWVGYKVEGGEEVRAMLVAVPYAMKAVDAETLGGRPASDFLLASQSLTRRLQTSTQEAMAAAPVSTGSSDGTANFIPKFQSSTTLVNSALFDSGGLVGVNTTAPTHALTVNGALSGMLNGFGPFWGITSNNVDGSNGGFNLQHLSGGVLRNGLVLNAAGNVGIAMNPTGFRLTLNGGLAAGLNGFGPFYSLTTNNIDATNGGATLSYLSGNVLTTGIMLNGIGRVGIGTASPTHRFTVNGSMAGMLNGFGPFYAINTNNVDGVNGGVTLQYLGGNVLRDGLTLNFAGNVGIGTNNPSTKLEILENSGAQAIKATQQGAGAGSFSISTPGTTAILGDATNSSGVTIGVQGISSADIGRAVVGKSLATSGFNMGVFGVSVNSPTGTGVWGEASAITGDAVGVYGQTSSVSGKAILGVAVATSGTAVGVQGVSDAAGGTGVVGNVTAASGNNVGVYGKISSGTGSAAMFDNTVTGNIIVGRSNTTNVFRVATTGQVFGASFNTSGADFAESVAVREEKSAYQPGDVMAVDSDGIRRFTKSSAPYSTLVAGIYSTKPGILATPHGIDDPRPEKEEIPLAVVGIVPCKVSNENGAIKAGDLLVASSIPGYAMKGTDRKRMTGAVIGKALQSMNGKTGVIEVLVSLQ